MLIYFFIYYHLLSILNNYFYYSSVVLNHHNHANHWILPDGIIMYFKNILKVSNSMGGGGGHTSLAKLWRGWAFKFGQKLWEGRVSNLARPKPEIIPHPSFQPYDFWTVHFWVIYFTKITTFLTIRKGV